MYPNTEEFTSPNGSGVVTLTYVGEIRFGPPYFALRINGKLLAERVFGEVVVWSPDSQYFAAQEWLTTSEAEGPQTSLVCFQPTTGKQCKVSGIRGGFIKPKEFVGEKLIYSKELYSNGHYQTTEYEIEFKSLPRWEAL
jgi:hypothetical protein